MAKPSEKELEYLKRAEGMTWEDLRVLWSQIQKNETPDWDRGKALEHLVVRAFQLGGLEVEYPYHVPPGGNPLEQIDGIIYMQSHTYLLECKDEDATDIEAIAKLRNQLLRRPETTLGCVFTKHHFTSPALIITDFSVPHRILLWSEADLDAGVKEERFAAILQVKYRHLCKYGLTDHSPYYKTLEVK